MTTLNNALQLLQLQIAQSQSAAVGALGVGSPRHDGYPPTLPAPLVPAILVHGGLNKNDLHDPSVPVAVQVVLDLQMAENDSLILYLNDQAVAVDVLSLEHLALGVFTFYLAPTAFSEGLATLHYHHTAITGGGISSSHPVGPFIVKLSVPGDPDPDPSTPYINEHLTAITGIPNPVPPGRPLTVTIPRYVNIAEGDEIVLYWSNREICKTVSDDEATNPNTSLTLSVSADIVDSTPGAGLIMRYGIHDKVMNWSLYSLEARTDVLPPGALHAPTVRDADDYDELDMDALGGGDVAIQIPVNGNLPVGTEGVLTWTGIPVIGPRLTFTLAFEIKQAATRLTLWVPNAKAAALVGSTATVYYEAIINGVSKPSQRASVQVIGQPVTLEKPRLTGVSGDSYNPALIIGSHQEVIVPAYGFMDGGQAVILHWEGRTASGSPFYVQQRKELTSDIQQDLRFLIDKAYATGLGTNTTLKVYYEIIADGVTYASPTLELTVVGVPSNLPKPATEPFFPGGEIDPGTVGTSIKVVVEPNSSLAPGDVLTVKWLGRSGASIILENQVFPNTGNLEISIGKTPYIDGNTNAYVDVSYEARRNGQPVGSSQVLQLHVGEAAALPWPLPQLVDATGTAASPWLPIRPGTAYESNTATVVVRDARIQSEDMLAVIWRLPGGTEAEVPAQATTAGEGRVLVPPMVLAQSLAKTIDIAYALLRGPTAEIIGSSQLTPWRIGALSTGLLKAPAVVEATDNATRINLNTFAGDAHVHVEPWPLMVAGQQYWLVVSGTRDDGEPYSERLPRPQIVQGNDPIIGITKTLTRNVLLRLEAASELTVHLKVAFNSQAPEGEAIMFPDKNLVVVQQVLNLPAPTVTGVVDGRLNPRDIPAAGVKIVARYTGQAEGQWVSAHWVGVTAALSQDFPAVQVTNASSPLEFTVPKAKAEASLFKAVSVVYKVARTQGAEAKTSEALPFEVQRPKGGYENFESFTVGDVDKLQLDGITLQRKWSGKLQISNSTAGAGVGIKGKSARALPTEGYYTGVDIFFDVPLASFSAVVFGAPKATYGYVDGSESLVNLPDGHHSFFEYALPGKTIKWIFLYNSGTDGLEIRSVYIDEILWTV